MTDPRDQLLAQASRFAWKVETLLETHALRLRCEHLAMEAKDLQRLVARVLPKNNAEQETG